MAAIVWREEGRIAFPSLLLLTDCAQKQNKVLKSGEGFRILEGPNHTRDGARSYPPCLTRCLTLRDNVERATGGKRGRDASLGADAHEQYLGRAGQDLQRHRVIPRVPSGHERHRRQLWRRYHQGSEQCTEVQRQVSVTSPAEVETGL